MADVIHDMPEAEYHAHPALGSTALRELLRSPRHYWSQYEAPPELRVVREETAALRRGKLVHVATLEPERWARDFVVEPQGDGRTKEVKAARAEFEKTSVGKTILGFDEHAEACAIAASVRSHPAARFLLSTVTGLELSIFWDDVFSAVRCKARLDVAKDHVVLDLKTTRDASPEGFVRSIVNYGYHTQGGHYTEAYRVGFDREPSAYVWIAVEVTAPYAVGVYAADAQMLAKGRQLRMRGLDRLVECRKTGVWPSYAGEKVTEISLPAWAA